MRILLLTPLIAVLVSCGDGKQDAAGRMAAGTDSTGTAAAEGTVMDLAKFDVPLLLHAPDKQMTGGADPEVIWKDEIGKLEIIAGDHFGLHITEEPGDVARLKADLERDLLKKNTVIKDTPDLVVYRSEFPDDPSLVYVHFYQVVKAGNRVFTVEDIDGGKRFNEQDVERMSHAVSVNSPA